MSEDNISEKIQEKGDKRSDIENRRYIFVYKRFVILVNKKKELKQENMYFIPPEVANCSIALYRKVCLNHIAPRRKRKA